MPLSNKISECTHSLISYCNSIATHKNPITLIVLSIFAIMCTVRFTNIGGGALLGKAIVFLSIAYNYKNKKVSKQLTHIELIQQSQQLIKHKKFKEHERCQSQVFDFLTSKGKAIPSPAHLLPYLYPALSYKSNNKHSLIFAEFSESHINFKYKNIVYLIFPKSVKVLIPTRNTLPQHEFYDREELIVHIQERETKTLQFLSIQPNPLVVLLSEEIDSNYFNAGVCLGITQCFINEYYSYRSDFDMSVSDAAISAARDYRWGASYDAAAMQWIHRLTHYNNTSAITPLETWLDAKVFFGLQLLKKRIVSTTIIQYPLINQLASLENGVYHITSEWLIKGQMFTPPGHATVFLVENPSFLIFDPIIGLLSHPNPDDYYMLHTQVNIAGFITCALVEEANAIDFTQRPKLIQPPGWSK